VLSRSSAALNLALGVGRSDLGDRTDIYTSQAVHMLGNMSAGVPGDVKSTPISTSFLADVSRSLFIAVCVRGTI
jgi:hypothetical protein